MMTVITLSWKDLCLKKMFEWCASAGNSLTALWDWNIWSQWLWTWLGHRLTVWKIKKLEENRVNTSTIIIFFLKKTLRPFHSSANKIVKSICIMDFIEVYYYYYFSCEPALTIYFDLHLAFCLRYLYFF